MATHDYEILNGSGLDVRTDLNAVLSAILSQNSSSTEPTTAVSGMFWYDTTAGILKQRNVNNDGWVEKWVVSDGRLATLNGPTFTGTVTLPTSTNLNGKTIATLDSPSFFGSVTAENLTASGSVSLPTTTSIGAISQTELSYLDGVSSNIQNQLSSKLTNTDYATSSVGGVVKVGDNLAINSGSLSVNLVDGYVTTARIHDGAVTVDKLPNYTSGSNLLALTNIEESTTGTSWSKLKEIRVKRSGVITVKFTLKTSNSNYASIGQIDVNDIIAGTQRSTTSTSYITYTEDITVNAGDLIQLYLKSSGATTQAYTNLLALYTGSEIDNCVVINN